MTFRCNRCDHRAEDDDAAAEHARETGHYRCIVCRRRSLTEFEPQTCAACVGRVRADLADIAQDFTLLEPSGILALTLRGDGTMQRLFSRDEWASYAVTVHPLAYAGEQVVKPIRDEWPSDPLPVIAALASWEDYWREDYGDPTGPAATLTGVVGYLTGNLDTGHRAAQTHPAFDEFAHEVTRLRSMVQHGAGLADVPLEADPKCFDCDGPLLRTFAPLVEPSADRRQRARHALAQLVEPVRVQRIAERSYGVRDVTPWPSGKIRDTWSALVAGRSGEGLVNDWTCGWCRRTYDQASYFLALRAASSSWVSVPLAAETAQRSVRTIRTWIRRLQVTAMCRWPERTVLVWWPDVSDRAFRHADDAPSQQSA